MLLQRQNSDNLGEFPVKILLGRVGFPYHQNSAGPELAEIS